MRLKNALATAALAFFGLAGLALPANAAGVDASASAACVKCHDEEDLADSSRHAHSQEIGRASCRERV